MKNLNSITLKDIAISRGDRIVISNLSVHFSPGTISAIIGPNGSGKSTLVDAISGYLPLSHGEIYYGDQNLKDLSIFDQSQYRSVVIQHQEYALGFKVRELISLGSTSISSAQIESALKDVGALHLIDRNISELSGGERQRISIAHALARNTNILIFDEPFSSQDSESKDQLIKLFSTMRDQGKTIILVAHMSSEELHWCDQIIKTNPQ